MLDHEKLTKLTLIAGYLENIINRLNSLLFLVFLILVAQVVSCVRGCL